MNSISHNLHNLQIQSLPITSKSGYRYRCRINGLWYSINHNTANIIVELKKQLLADERSIVVSQGAGGI